MVRVNKEVKTHLDMVAIYDKFREAFKQKHELELSYTEVSRRIAKRINKAGGIKL